MLGQRLIDPQGIDRGPGIRTDSAGHQQGLGLLDLDTEFERDKLLRSTQARFGPMPQAPQPWARWAQVAVKGYEIHQGRTRPASSAEGLQPVLFDDQGQCLGWRQGAVMGLYLHGLLECEPALQALLGQGVAGLDTVFDGLADHVDRHFEPGSLMTLLQQAAP
jgi:adenosylcobyric acid synthase